MLGESDGARTRRMKAAAFFLAVAFVVAGVAAFSSYVPKNPEARSTTTAKSSTTPSQGYVSSNSLGGLPYFNASRLYASLGFPVVSYSSAGTDIPYLRSEPNFTLQVELGSGGYDASYANISAPVMDLQRAVSLAADYAKLNPVNYTLAEAVFYPGLGSSWGVVSDPEWHLYFEQIYAGYWIFDFDAGGWPIEADVDALNGAVVLKGGAMANLPVPGQYDLKVSSSSALETVRALNLTDMPALTKNGTVNFIAPLVAFPGLSPNSQWLNASGDSRLAWIVEMGYDTVCCSQGGTFAVDAETGALLGDSELGGIGMIQAYVSTSFLFSTATNMTVSKQTYPLDGSTVGTSGSVLAAFSDVLTVKPGSNASVALNVSAGDMKNPPKVSFSFSDPFGYPVENLSSSGAPPGVAFRLSNPDLVLQPNLSANTTLFVSVDEDAPTGTYFILLQPTQSPASQIVGGNVIFFFLSVWNGAGQWPPPPLIG